MENKMLEKRGNVEKNDEVWYELGGFEYSEPMAEESYDFDSGVPVIYRQEENFTYNFNSSKHNSDFDDFDDSPPVFKQVAKVLVDKFDPIKEKVAKRLEVVQTSKVEVEPVIINPEKIEELLRVDPRPVTVIEPVDLLVVDVVDETLQQYCDDDKSDQFLEIALKIIGSKDMSLSRYDVYEYDSDDKWDHTAHLVKTRTEVREGGYTPFERKAFVYDRKDENRIVNVMKEYYPIHGTRIDRKFVKFLMYYFHIKGLSDRYGNSYGDKSWVKRTRGLLRKMSRIRYLLSCVVKNKRWRNYSNALRFICLLSGNSDVQVFFKEVLDWFIPTVGTDKTVYFRKHRIFPGVDYTMDFKGRIPLIVQILSPYVDYAGAYYMKMSCKGSYGYFKDKYNGYNVYMVFGWRIGLSKLKNHNIWVDINGMKDYLIGDGEIYPQDFWSNRCLIHNVIMCDLCRNMYPTVGGIGYEHEEWGNECDVEDTTFFVMKPYLTPHSKAWLWLRLRGTRAVTEAMFCGLLAVYCMMYCVKVSGYVKKLMTYFWERYDVGVIQALAYRTQVSGVHDGI